MFLSMTPEFSEQCTDIINISAKKVEKKPPLYLTESRRNFFLMLPRETAEKVIRHMAILTLFMTRHASAGTDRPQRADVTIGRCCKRFC